MAIRKSSNSGIPFGNTASRPASPSLGQPYFNGEVGRLELYSSNGWQNIVQETPGVASASGTYNESAGSGTFTISGTNFVDGAIAYAVGTNGTEYQATTTTYNSLVQVTAVFSNLSPAYEPYDIKITNPSNLFGLLSDAFYINDSPVWATSSGSLGTWDGSSIQLSATDDESNTITYSVTSGSLPSGLSLSSSGLISGTITANVGTYTFTVSASDGVNTAVTRSFSINAPFPTVSGGTLTSDSTYYYRTFTSTQNLVVTDNNITADYLVVAGGGGGGTDLYTERTSGGGGAGGYRAFTSQSIPTGTLQVLIGGGGAGASGGNNQAGVVGSNGTASSFNSITSAGGGGGAGHDLSGNYKAGDGGSGGGSTHDAGTQGFASPAGQGNNGGTPGLMQGGVGLQWLNGTYYAGGGAGSTSPAMVPNTGAGGGGAGGTALNTGSYVGGLGGGGNSGNANGSFSGGAGSSNTGGGGGASRKTTGAAGGSGIVIVRYTKASVGD